MRISKILYGTLALTFATPVLSFAATDKTTETNSSAKIIHTYPEMTADDCGALNTRKNSYTASEFRDRTTYCNKFTSDKTARRSDDRTINNVTPDSDNSGATRSDTPADIGTTPDSKITPGAVPDASKDSTKKAY